VREIRTSNDPERVRNTIFGGVLSSSLPEEEKTDFRLASETQLVVFAGEGTTGKRSPGRTSWWLTYDISTYPQLRHIRAPL
jgi:hypothetical protein